MTPDLAALVAPDRGQAPPPGMVDSERYRAAERLALVASRPAVRRALLRALLDRRAHVRLVVLHALAGAGPAATVLGALMLCSGSLDESFAVRWLAILTLSELAAELPRRAKLRRRVEDHLIDLLDHPDVELRFFTIKALGDLRARTATPRQMALANTDERVLPGVWSIAEAAQDAIARIRGEESPFRKLLAERLSGPLT